MKKLLAIVAILGLTSVFAAEAQKAVAPAKTEVVADAAKKVDAPKAEKKVKKAKKATKKAEKKEEMKTEVPAAK